MKHPIDDYVVNGDIVFDALFDYDDLFEALRRDFPDLTEHKIKGVMFRVLSGLTASVEDLLWDAAYQCS